MQYLTDQPPEPVKKTQWSHFFLFGLVGEVEIDLAMACPDGVSRVELFHSALNQLLGVVTVGFYTPTTVDYWCAAPEPRAFHRGPLDARARLARGSP